MTNTQNEVMLPTPAVLKACAMPKEMLNAIVEKYVQRDPAECVENHEGCAGSVNLRECLEILEGIIIDLFNDHMVEAPNLPAPRVDDSILLQIAQTNVHENPVNFIRNRWQCANTSDVVTALKVLRALHEDVYNKGAFKAGLLAEMPAESPLASAAPATQSAEVRSDAGSTAARLPRGWQPYATVPRDGTLIDLFYKKSDGTLGRITNVRFIFGAAVNVNYAPGGCWENLCQDGWRRTVEEDSVLVDVGFTHWRLVETDMPLDI